MSTEPDPTDEELALRAQGGDDAAFQRLYERHADALARRIHQRLSPMLRRKVDEGDVLQMAYLSAHRSLENFEARGAGSFRAWLEQIVEHKILYVVRQYVQVEKRGVHREETGSFHQRAPALRDREASPSGLAVAGELRDRIERAMEELPDAYREVIGLVQREGLTLAAAAERMERSTAATAKLYGRALAKLSALTGLGETDA